MTPIGSIKRMQDLGYSLPWILLKSHIIKTKGDVDYHRVCRALRGGSPLTAEDAKRLATLLRRVEQFEAGA